MSQAFVKEGDAGDDLPERPLSDRPNYVTPAGLSALRRRQEELLGRRPGLLKSGDEAALKSVDRDLRYLDARLKSAVVVDRSGGEPAEARFGATVELRGPAGPARYSIVGEDEADPDNGKISWSSPLALALMGAKPGDEVSWPGPDGELRGLVLSVAYP